MASNGLASQLLGRRNCAGAQPTYLRDAAEIALGNGDAEARNVRHRRSMDLTIDGTQGDVAVIVLPFDELDASNSAEFKRDVGPILEGRSKVVFDLERVRFVDSSGLGAFLSCLRRVNAGGGDLKLCDLSKPVRAVFELVRMHRVFDIHPTREAAVAAFASTRPSPPAVPA
jgi:anti-sigma B factor antagonist